MPVGTKTATRLRSMTGYAETVAEQDGALLTVSLRSVNHRFLDLHVHLPEALQSLEAKVRKQVQVRNPRGRLELRITVEPAGRSSPAVDEAMLERYIELFRRLGAQYGLSPETDLATLCQLPGVVTPARSAAGGRDWAPRIEAALLRAVAETLDRWDEMRAAEARFLADDMEKRASGLRESVERLERLHAESVPAAQEKLQERLQVLAGKAGLDPNRLAQEAAALADRADASEEILRLKAHVQQFSALLESEADAGRKLDFLLQEMHRELNTLLSKAAALGASSLPLSGLVLEAKAEVEKLREQAQNIQ